MSHNIGNRIYLEKLARAVGASKPDGALGQTRPTTIARVAPTPPAPRSPTNATAIPGDNNGEAVASTLPAPSSPNGAGILMERGCVKDQPQHGVEPTNRERAAADAAHTAALPE